MKSIYMMAIVSIIVLAIPCTMWSEEACSEQGPQTQRIKAGDVYDFHAETKHPYDNGNAERSVVWKDIVRSAGALFVRVRFSAFDLNDGDYVTVSNPEGTDFWTYTLKGPRGTGKFWSFAVDGDTAIVRLHAGPRGKGYGYKISKVGHGTIDWKSDQVYSQVVCNGDGREEVACRTSNPAINTAQRPVNRMLFTSGGSQYVCTGWLVSGSNPNTMLTNNHCISTQAEASSLQAKFNYQRSACKSKQNASTTDYAGGTLLKTNAPLDYTIMTLQGNPEATWGELVATTKGVSVGNQIWFIQHPGGGVKKIGYFEDKRKTTLCKIDRVNQTYVDTAASSQMAYGCDSAGGSSGSPIIDAATGRVIGLHHYGGVSSNPCLNAATEMPEICSNAGSLISCASN